MSDVYDQLKNDLWTELDAAQCDPVLERLISYVPSNSSEPTDEDEWVAGTERFLADHKGVLAEWGMIGNAL